MSENQITNGRTFIFLLFNRRMIFSPDKFSYGVERAPLHVPIEEKWKELAERFNSPDIIFRQVLELDDVPGEKPQDRHNRIQQYAKLIQLGGVCSLSLVADEIFHRRTETSGKTEPPKKGVH